MGQQEILDYLKSGRKATNEEMAIKLDLCTSNVSRSTKLLYKEGLLDRINLASGRREKFKYWLK